MPLIGKGNVKKAILSMESNANDNLRGVYLSGLSKIIASTPADTGRARNNWFLSVNNPSNKVTKGKGSSSENRLNKMPKRVLNRVLFFTNNLPYAHKLEYGGFTNKPETDKTIGGFSKQLDQSSPKGFIRKALIKMKNKIRMLR